MRVDVFDALDISIHAPREGCDPSTISPRRADCVFQSTHPVRGATGDRNQPIVATVISIHAPREGCDLLPQTHAGILTISIHAPREGCDFLSFPPRVKGQ